jgi:hypothetical protein
MAPSNSATVAVAAALATASTLYLGATARWRPRRVYRVGARGAATALVARAIGDRRYVGFLKRSRDSPFARRDTYLYSPLCGQVTGAWRGRCRRRHSADCHTQVGMPRM